MQFIDLQAQYRALEADVNARIREVLRHGRFILGPEVEELEGRLADYVGRKHCVTCASGTDALLLAFLAHGIGPGDAVFCPDVTFAASVEPACLLGAEPVFCDVTGDTRNLSLESLEQRLEAVRAQGRLRPRAVVAVDFLGNPADYRRLEAFCKGEGLTLIEDGAQSFGARSGDRRCGSFGDMAATSFFPAKPLGCYGDGGALFTDDGETAALCRSLRAHGQGPEGKYHHVRVGLNSRLDTIQAAVLLAKLDALEGELEARQRVARRYGEALLAGRLEAPVVRPGDRSAYAQYAVLAKNQAQRDALLAHLRERGIPCMVYYPEPLHRMPVFAGLDSHEGEFLNAEDYCRRTLSLPMSPYLTEQDQDAVIAAVWEALE